MEEDRVNLHLREDGQGKPALRGCRRGGPENKSVLGCHSLRSILLQFFFSATNSEVLDLSLLSRI